MGTTVLAIFIVMMLRWSIRIDKFAGIKQSSDVCARIRMARFKAGLPPEPEND